LGRYVVRRILQLILVFIGVTLLIYGMVYALPGDPIRGMAGDRPLAPSVVRTLQQRYHLNDPFFVQYGKYIWGLLHGDLGQDFNGNNVSTLMSQRWPITIRLALTAWVIEVVFGLALGIVAALRRGKWVDHTVLVFTIAVVSVPIFVLGYTAQLLLGVKAHILPVSGAVDGWPRSYILPAVILAAFGLASVARLTRTSVLENLRSDYVRTAISKGLSTPRIVIRHVLRNSLIAAITYLAIDLGYLLGGTVIIEGIFNLPGVGQLLFTSIQTHEGAVVVGVSTALVLIFLLANLVVDLLYGVLDPRIRYD
jgi:ABC-type dipeptide/oligopeptide/nickel transport system permease component